MVLRQISIREVKPQDMLAVTRMTFANMVGADRQFTRITRNPIGRWITFLSLPIYLVFSGRGYKALVDGQLAGCAFIHFRSSSAYVFNVGVNKPYRQQGVGRCLMQHLEQLTKEHNLDWMVLQVDDGNLPAQNLYEKTGYQPYNPEFLRRSDGMELIGRPLVRPQIEQLPSYSGYQLFRRYSNIERQAGDRLVAQLLDEYELGSSRRGSIWRCTLDGSEIGCAQVEHRAGRLIIDLLFQPPYWGHPSTIGFIWRLTESSGQGASTVDVHFGSSAHYAAAYSQLEGYGFRSKRYPRLLMFKPLS